MFLRLSGIASRIDRRDEADRLWKILSADSRPERRGRLFASPGDIDISIKDELGELKESENRERARERTKAVIINQTR